MGFKDKKRHWVQGIFAYALTAIPDNVSALVSGPVIRNTSNTMSFAMMISTKLVFVVTAISGLLLPTPGV
jgi:hypothetical protein